MKSKKYKVRKEDVNIKRLEDIIVWQKAGELCLTIYRRFGKCKDFWLKDRINRLSVLVINNIADGFERIINKGFKNFLYIAKSSCGEARSMIYSAVRLGYLNEEKFKRLYKLSVEISKLLSGLIRSSPQLSTFYF